MIECALLPKEASQKLRLDFCILKALSRDMDQPANRLIAAIWPNALQENRIHSMRGAFRYLYVLLGSTFMVGMSYRSTQYNCSGDREAGIREITRNSSLIAYQQGLYAGSAFEGTNKVLDRLLL